jgi:hypothetical protein
MRPNRPRFRAARIAAWGIFVLLGSPPSGWCDSGNAARSAQGTSSVVLHTQQGRTAIDITNVTFMTTGSYVPGRPPDERLLLRVTRTSREAIDEKGLDATVTVEAWPLGADPAEAPLYAVTLDGVDATVVDNAVIVFERGTEDVAWQSIHSLGTGAPLFDTFVPMLQLPPPEAGAPRFVGLDVPPDDALDERLRDPKVVGVLAYASPERVIRRLLITCSDVERAAAFRSYWDTTRGLSSVRHLTTPDMPAEKVLINWWPTGQAMPNVPMSQIVTAVIPIVGDDLDIAHAQMPACTTLAPWSP